MALFRLIAKLLLLAAIDGLMRAVDLIGTIPMIDVDKHPSCVYGDEELGVRYS